MVVDPYQKREAKKYKNSIPSREYISSWLKKCQDLISQKNRKKIWYYSSRRKKHYVED